MTDIFNQPLIKSSNNLNKIFQYCVNLVSYSLKELEDSWIKKFIDNDIQKDLIQSLFSLLNYEIIFIQQVSKYYDLYTNNQQEKNYSMVQQIITLNKMLINKSIQKIISLKFVKRNNSQGNIFHRQEIHEKINFDSKNKRLYPLNLSMYNKNFDEMINSNNTVIYRNNIITNNSNHHKIFLNQMSQRNKIPTDLKNKFYNSKSCKNLNFGFNSSNNISLENENLYKTLKKNSQRLTLSLSPKKFHLSNSLFNRKKKNDLIFVDDNPVRKVKNIIINAKISNSFFNEVMASKKNKQKDGNNCENLKKNDLEKSINNSIKVNKVINKNKIDIIDWEKYKNEHNNIIKVNYKKEKKCGEVLQDGTKKTGKRLKSASDRQKNSLPKNKYNFKSKEKNK